MGDRLRDYGFVNPFRSHIRGSNYNASLSNLSGGAIDQWLADTAAYNKIIRDYGLTSQIEYKQPDGTWGVTPPETPNQDLIFSPARYRGGFSNSSDTYSIYSPYNNVSGFNSPSSSSPNVNVMPEYRWRIVGDVDGANNALREAGLQGSYTTPRGEKVTTGARIQNIVSGPKVTVNVPGLSGPGTRNRGNNYTYFTDSSDPLGMGVGSGGNAFSRTYRGESAPSYYTFIGSEPGARPHQTTLSPSYGSYQIKQIADEIFSNPNIGELAYNPDALKSALSSVPEIRNSIGQYINDTASYWRSRDDGGGALGVIARGLSGTAQFLSMASGLNAAVSFAGSLASGAGLGSAIGAARAGAGAIPSLGGGLANLAGNPALSNAISAGIGAITGGAQGGVPGAALGAISGYAPSPYGGAIRQIGNRLGIGVPPPPPQQPSPFQMTNVPRAADAAAFRPAPPGSISSGSSMVSMPTVAPASSAGTVASALAAQPTAGISPQAAVQTPVAPPAPMGAPPQLMSSIGLLGGAMNPQLQQLMSAAPRGGLLTGGLGNIRPVTFGGMPVNQQSLMANLPQVLANIRSRAGGAPPAAA